MLDKFLAVAYSGEQKKTAARQLVDKLKTYPIEELKKLASGDPDCKLAYADACGPGRDDTWLGKYKGTPLFAKAVELEKSLVQLDMEDQQMRAQERAVRPDPNDTWMKRDAINLQKRMLDLDLVMAENGGDPTEAAPAEAVPAEAGGAPPPAPPKEKAAPEAPAEAGGGEGGEPSEEEVLQALEAEAGGAGGEGAPPQQQQQQPKPKAPPQQAQGEGEEEETEEEETEEEGQPPKKDDKPKGMSVEVKQSSAKTAAAAAVGAGALFAKLASSDSKVRREVAKKFPQLAKEKTAALPIGTVPGVLGAAAGADKAHHAGQPGSGALRGGLGAAGGATLGGELGLMLGKEHPGAGLLGAAAGGLAGYGLATRKYNKPADEADGIDGLSPEDARSVVTDMRQSADDVDTNPGKYRLRRALYGGALGAATGGALAGGKGALLGGGGAALLGALPRPSGRALRDDADSLEQRHFPQEKKANILGALGGAASAAKGLATSAHAAGGLPQVAKSFGSVAKNFAQKNPLTAAGIAGAGGLMAGKALSPSQPRA